MFKVNNLQYTRRSEFKQTRQENNNKEAVCHKSLCLAGDCETDKGLTHTEKR